MTVLYHSVVFRRKKVGFKIGIRYSPNYPSGTVINYSPKNCYNITVTVLCHCLIEEPIKKP
jgi:hypothetical protein